MPYLALYSGGSLHGRWERLIVLPAAIIFYDPATGIREEYQRTTPALTSPACYQLKGTITAVAADSYIRPDDRVEITGPIDTDNPPPAGMQGTVTDVWNRATAAERIFVKGDDTRSYILEPGDPFKVLRYALSPGLQL